MHAELDVTTHRPGDGFNASVLFASSSVGSGPAFNQWNLSVGGSFNSRELVGRTVPGSAQTADRHASRRRQHYFACGERHPGGDNLRQQPSLHDWNWINLLDHLERRRGPAVMYVLAGTYTIAAPVVLASGAAIENAGNSVDFERVIERKRGTDNQRRWRGCPGWIGPNQTGDKRERGHIADNGEPWNSGPVVCSLSSLIIGSSGAVAILNSASHANRTLLVTGGLSLVGSTSAWQGKLDLGNNDLDVQGGSLATITNQIQQGSNGGNWNASAGILSSSAASDSRHLDALGVIKNNQGGTALFGAGNLFDGTVPNASDILVKFTYYGDANLDGHVDGSDYSRIDSGYLSRLTGWYNGDFNYDGVVNGSDYTLIDNAFNTQGASLAALISSQPASATAEAVVRTDLSAIPEPTGLSLAAAAAAGLLGRRRSPGSIITIRPGRISNKGQPGALSK